MANLDKVQVTENELVNILLTLKGTQFISFKSITQVKMGKFIDYWIFDKEGKKRKNPNPTANPFLNNVLCRSYRKDILINFSYEQAVQGRQEKEGKEADFKVKQNWFEHFMDSKIVVQHKGSKTNPDAKGKKYLSYQYLLQDFEGHKKSRSEHEYFFNQNRIEKNLIAPFMIAPSEYKNQNLENPLLFQTLDFDNLIEITLQGKTYEMID